MSGAQVWVIDDDRSIRWVLERALGQAGMAVTVFENGAEAIARLGREQPDVVVSDIRMPEMDGLSVLEKISARHPQLPVIIMTAYSDLESTVSAYQGGAFEYLPKPFDVDEAVALVHRALGRKKESVAWQAPAGTAATTISRLNHRPVDLVTIFCEGLQVDGTFTQAGIHTCSAALTFFWVYSGDKGW